MKWQKKKQIQQWVVRILALVLAAGLLLSTLIYSLIASFGGAARRQGFRE